MRQAKNNNGGFLPQTLDVDDSIIDQNLKIIDNQSVDDKISGIFPGLVNNANASTAKHYETNRKLLPTEEYPIVQVKISFIIKNRGSDPESLFDNPDIYQKL